MAKYSVKFEIEVIVNEDFKVGEIDEAVENKLTDEQWNEIVSDAVNTVEDLENNVVEITRVDDDDDDDDDDDRRGEMPWDYGKHFE